MRSEADERALRTGIAILVFLSVVEPFTQPAVADALFGIDRQLSTKAFIVCGEFFALWLAHREDGSRWTRAVRIAHAAVALAASPFALFMPHTGRAYCGFACGHAFFLILAILAEALWALTATTEVAAAKEESAA